jgi:NAD(P)-dependent dehydrogenase (short-subunit alcohol dehydrogenase family)
MSGRDDTTTAAPVALITGGSAGLGLALARGLAGRGWTLVLDARGEQALRQSERELAARTRVLAIPGDVADAAHRQELAAAVTRLGRLDVLVNNASTLGPEAPGQSPLPPLERYPLAELERVFRVNTVAPLGLVQLLLPLLLHSHAAVLNISSDAAVEAYPGWGGYGAAKAALDHLSAVLAIEQPDLDVYAVDPGDLRTAMHQRAFAGEDISDRPEPATVVPALLRLIDSRPASGRYRGSDLRSPAGAA